MTHFMTDTMNIRPPMWLPVLVVILGGGFYVYGQSLNVVDATHQPIIISVSADAKVSGSPDIATLSFGVQTGRQTTAKAAIENVRKNMTTVLAAIKKAGIEDKDIMTENFWLNPVYDYDRGTQIPRGYEANQSLRVKVRNLDAVGDVLSAATDAGANQVGSISFDIDNPDALKADARAKAIEKAKAKADTLAESLGMRVIKLTGFSEGGGNYPVPMMSKTMAYGMGGGSDAVESLPVPVGEQEIGSTVTLMYEIR